MVTGLAFLATAVAALFAEAAFVRWLQRRSPHLSAWAVALGLFALASGLLALGTSNGWNRGTFRVFYLFGAVLNVPWLALGSVALLLGSDVARRVRWFLVFFSGLAAGVLLSAPMDPVHGTAIPVGKDVFDAGPRVLAAVGSGVGATAIIVGAVWSAGRAARHRRGSGEGRLALANALVALGTLVLSGGGLVQGIVGHDEAFTLTLAVGIGVIYAGFVTTQSLPAGREPLLRSTPQAPSRRRA
ncbi:MAG: hypothetical protein WD598_00240 [Acidimicrobiia bacterium]